MFHLSTLKNEPLIADICIKKEGAIWLRLKKNLNFPVQSSFNRCTLQCFSDKISKKKSELFKTIYKIENGNTPNILFDHRVIGCGSIKFGQIKKKNTQNCSVVKFVETYFCNPLEAKCDKTAKTFKVDPCYI